MKSIQLILADQLFETNKDIECDTFVMIESLQEAKRYNYHLFKLGYLFSAMRNHADFLRSHGKIVHYIGLEEQKNFKEVLKDISNMYQTLLLLPTNDHWFESELSEWQTVFKTVKYTSTVNQSFLTTKEEFKSWLALNGTRKIKMANFYIWQRKRLDILVEDGKPVGGDWSYDTENRKKLPKTVELPKRTWSYDNAHYTKIFQLLKKLLPKHPGLLDVTSWIPLTTQDAKHFLVEFIKESLQEFGPYEDAMSTRSKQLFHSVLSPLLNNGLITPDHVIKAVLHAYNTGKITHLASVEGFIRQVIGWREWIKGLYDTTYKLPYSQYNFFKHTKPLPKYFYDLSLAPQEVKDNTPLYDTLLTVHELSWCHHIPRLMILANWMTLNEYDPMECYEWFLSQFVDGAEWVMVPNVFGMGLFADGGIFATKPYIGGGNYIKNMSDYPQVKIWERLWTDLYWNFILKHKDFFAKNPRMAMIIKAKFK
jgi:deoxyribodipyrimidine photolyase-related protein